MGSDIEISVFGQVPDPAQGVIPAPLLDLQISNRDAGESIVWDFKFDVHWSLFELISVLGLNYRCVLLTFHIYFLFPIKLLQLPRNTVLVRLIFQMSTGAL